MSEKYYDSTIKMTKESNGKESCASNTSSLRKGGGRTRRRAILIEQQLAFCSAYVRIGSATGAAVYAGYHPASGYRLLENPAIKGQIQKLKEVAERREEQLAEKAFFIEREFLDAHLAHQIANGETHKTRGDADRVKAIEIGYKALGVIQSNRAAAQASAGRISAGQDSVRDLQIEMAARERGSHGRSARRAESQMIATSIPHRKALGPAAVCQRQSSSPRSAKRNLIGRSSVKATDLRLVKETLLELDASLAGTEEDESYKTALVLLSALACAPDTTRLAEFTQLPREFVAPIRQRMIRAQLWTESDACCDHWYVADGVFCTTFFWLDVLVAQGLVVRQWVEEEGEYRYWDECVCPTERTVRRKSELSTFGLPAGVGTTTATLGKRRLRPLVPKIGFTTNQYFSAVCMR